jgi:ferritin
MKEREVECLHNCKNTCSMLNEALRKETALSRFYEDILEQCTMPDVSSFVTDQIEEKRKCILRIVQKLNEIHARSQIIDGISSSYNV